MKILFIARRFPPSVGGMERFAYDLSNALEDKVTMKKLTWGGSNKWLPVVLPWFFVRGAVYLAMNRDVDVIHMQDAVQAPIGWLLHKIFKKPYIVVAHGLDITYHRSFYQKVIIPFVRRANAVISISIATNDEAIKRGVDESKAHVITLGTHDDYLVVTPDRDKLEELIACDLKGRKLLLTTGRLVKRKGVEWFIRNVLPELVQQDNTVLYLVAGDGAEKQAILTAIDETDMSDYVAILGRVSDEARSLLYQSCDVFVMPNIKVEGDMEGFGIVVHEAATACLPVVASNIEGIKDALHNDKNGVLVESKSVAEFELAINGLLSDKATRAKFGQAARNYTLKTYGWDNIAKQYDDVYRKIVS